MSGFEKRTITASLVLVLVGCAGSLHADLVHHWPFDETSGLVAQDVASGADGELINFEENDDAQWDDGQFSGGLNLAADFTPDNYVEVTLPALDAAATGGFTVAMWINPGEMVLTPGEYQLLSTPGDAIGFTIMNTTRGAAVHDRVLLFWDGNLQDLHVGTTTLEPGEWYHVAITSTGAGGEKSYYVDGVLEEEALFDPSQGGTPGNDPASRGGWGAGTARIGAINNAARTHDSIIDDVRIYDEALSEARIRDIIDNPTIPAPTIHLLTPQPDETFHDAADGIEFEVVARDGGGTIAADGITLVLNDVDVSGDLTIAGSETIREVEYGQLEADQVYNARIEAVDSNGAVARRGFTFATLPPSDEPDLLHHYRLDETAGLTAIDSAGGANATLLNFEIAGDAHWVPGKSGGALDLGADATTDNYARMDVPAFDGFATGGFTVAMWVNPGSRILTPGEYQLLSTPGDSIGFTIMNTTRGGRVHDRVLLFWDGSLPDLHVGTTTLEPGNWYHVAITSTGPGGEKLYYVNGFEEEQQLFDPAQGGSEGFHFATRADWAAGTAQIGGINGANRTHDSIIDDVRIYGVPLEEDEIQDIVGEQPAEALQLTNVSPSSGDLFHDAGAGVTFTVVSPNAGASIEPEGVRLTLNGQDVSADLAVTGTDRERTVAYDQLEANTSYDGVIEAIDTRGGGVSLGFSFGTFARTEPALRHHYRLDETEGLLAADSVLGNDASLVNFEAANDSQWVPGQVDGALDFGADGTNTSYATMQLPALDGNASGGFTIAMWLNPGDAILSPGEYQLVATPGDSVGFTIMNTVRGDRTHDRVLLFWDGSLPDLHVGTTTLEPGTWYHVAITSTGAGGEKSYFVDGDPEEQRLFDEFGGGVEGEHLVTRGGWPSGAGSIGAINNGARTHGSIIDDLRIYDVALTEEDIARLASGEPQGGLRVPGDCNGDASVNITDPVCLLGFLFQGSPEILPCGDGTQEHPGNVRLLDLNGDGGVNLSDPVALLNFLFAGGPAHVLAVPGAEQTACVPIEGCSDDTGCR